MLEAQLSSTARNISYSAIGKVIAFGFQAIANVILSRELVASDYGIFNFAMILVNLMRMLSDMGINTAAVQKKNFDDKSLYTAFTLKLLLGLVIYAILYVLSGFAVHFFDDPNVVNVIRLLALSIIINTFAFMPWTILARSLRLKERVIAETANTLSSSIIAVILAIVGFKFWSIVIAFIASNAILVLVVNYYQPCKISFEMDKTIALELLRYGWHVLLASIISFAVYNFDNFIVGSVGGSNLLGFYGLAFNWGSMVCGIMSAVVLSILFPTFSRMQDDPQKMKQSYLDVLQYTVIFSVLWNLTLFCVADRFLVHVLGKGTDKWMPALGSLRIFCVYGIVRSLIEPTNTLLMASGNAKLVLKSGVVVAFFELLFIYPAIFFGSIETVSVVVLITFMSQLFFLRKYVGSNYGVTFREVAAITLPAVMVAFVVAAMYFLGNGLIFNNLTGLLLAITLTGTLYLAIYGWLTGWQHYSRIYKLVRR